MRASRRPPEDIACIALLHAYAPWLELGGATDGVAEHVDAVECALVRPTTKDLAVVTRHGPVPMVRLLEMLPAHVNIHIHVPDSLAAMPLIRLGKATETSHRFTFIARHIGVMQVTSLTEHRIAIALETEDAETAKDFIQNQVVDAIVCSPKVADEEVMLLSWEKRTRVYVGVLDTRDEISEWIEKGADGIRTRNPALFLQALGPRLLL